MSAITLEGDIVHYEVLGRGRPLIFLHGWVGSWRYWLPAMQAASIAFRAYALDLWGFGDTQKTAGRYTLEDQVTLLAGFLENLGIGKIALVGHGLGAVVALLFAARRPVNVDRVLVTGLPLNEAALHPRLRGASPLELADWLLARSPANEPMRNEALKAEPAAILASLADPLLAQIPNLVATLATPVLFVQGQNDPAIEALALDAAALQRENMHTIVFEQSGHFPMLDETSQYNRLLNDFLSLPSGESPRQLQLKEEWKRRIR